MFTSTWTTLPERWVTPIVKMFVGIHNCLKISKEMINAQCKKTQCGSDAWWQAKGAAKLMSCCFCRILGCVSLLNITMWLCHHHHCIVSIFTLHKTLWMTQDHCDNLVKKVDYWSSQMMGGWLFIEGGTPLNSTHWSYQTGEGLLHSSKPHSDQAYFI